MSNIRQIARLAGVSIATVSLALHDHPRIPAQTREKIKEIARKLDYTLPNQYRPRFTNEIIIGYLLHDCFGVVATDILRGAMEEARHANIGMLMTHVAPNPAWIEEAIHSLLDKGIRGLALAHACLKPLPRRILVTLRSRGVHLVQIMKRQFAEPLDCACRDEGGYAREAAEHLAALGHRRVLGLGLHEQKLWDEQFRAQGIEGAFLFCAAGATMNEQGFKYFLQMTPRPTACIACMDSDAYQFSMLAQLHGLSVPGDLSVLGMGNFGYDWYPHISTIDIQSQEMGRAGIRLLAQRIADGVPPHEITDFHDIVLPAHVIDRGSTGLPK